MQKQLIFKCLPAHCVHLQRINTKIVVGPNQVIRDLSSQGLINSLKYRSKLEYLGKSYSKLMLPCIPGLEHALRVENQNQKEYPFKGLIKVPYQTEIKGYASGKRSAIIIKEDKIIRLKGCGNLLEGFILENDQIRGSHYFHTAKRQLFMTKLIDEVLRSQIGMKCGNIPLCFYEYTENLAKYQIKNQLPLIGKYCCVFETVGDRRAGTHLISPLQTIFLSLCDVKSVCWAQMFKENNRLDSSGIVQYIVDFELNVEKGQKFIEQYDLRNTQHNYIDLSKRKEIIPNCQNFKEKVTLLCQRFAKNSATEIIQTLTNFKQLFSVILIILGKVGWEMGRIKRAMCEKSINWGFFNDHGAWHCNAHLNNFVVTAPKSKEQFLYPLDYDIAFTKDQFIDIEMNSDSYGKHDSDVFQSMLLGEYNAMQMSLSGMQIISNFKYSIEEKQLFETDDVLKMARVAFRDTLIRSFRGGMKNQKERGQEIDNQWNNKINEIQSLVKVCLTISSQFQT